MADDVPHAGSRPDDFRFPFAEANAALAAIEDAVAELQAMVAVHEGAVAGARVDFEGETRTSFDQGFTTLLGQVDTGVRRLESQRDQLADDIDEAQRRRQDRLEAIGDWNCAMDRSRTLQGRLSGVD
jgi:hypothetical protein